jgi:hypothetical protein
MEDKSIEVSSIPEMLSSQERKVCCRIQMPQSREPGSGRNTQPKLFPLTQEYKSIEATHSKKKRNAQVSNSGNRTRMADSQ